MNPYSYSSPVNQTAKMSSQSDINASESTDINQEKQTESNNNETTEQETKQSKPMKKVKSKKDLKNDPNRFEVPGVNFNAKLIGIDDVESARGDKMCQESMARLKIAVKTSGQHKQKIIINVSLEGIRIIDVRTQATNHTHPVHRISFISRDITDARAFGYVYGAGEGKHKFFAIKTEKAAEALVLTLRDLFQVVYEMKKKEVEEAKNKIEEPEKATEAADGEEPVYSVVDKSKPAEGGSESTYQVPTNNAPVVEDTHDLLNLENELETIEKRIEQIDTMEELFKELEAPPPASQASTTAPTSSWASDLAGLSTAPTVAQNQGMFSLGGAPFPPSSQGFGTQPFGMPATQTHPSGFGGMTTQPAGGPMMGGASFGAAPNPFQPAPSVPPRAGVGFGGQASGFPAQPFPGTPFPGTQPQSPGFPQAPGMPPNQAGLPVSADPFGNDPFADNSGFGEPMLEPAKLEIPKEEAAPTNTKKDAFGDLVNIGSKDKQMKSPKDLFADLSTLPKRSLNELKVEPTPKKPASPVGSHSSGEEAFPTTDPAFTENDPFGLNDPFADDPFSSSGSISKPSLEHSKNNHASQSVIQTLPEAQQSPFQTTEFDGTYDLPSPEGPPPPLPEGPPPPLPEGPPPSLPQIPPPPLPKGPPPPLPADLVSPESHYTPVLPPRPVIEPPVNPMPPVPPRPKSASSDSAKGSMSSLNSLTESQPQVTPPVPPRTKPANTTTTTTDIVPVPRPRPRPSKNSTSSQSSLGHTNKTSEQKSQTEKPVVAISNHVNNESELDKNDNEIGARTKINSMHSKDPFCDIDRKVESQWSVNSKSDNTQNQSSTSSVKSDKKVLKTNLSTCSVSDPFVNTDPFASDDPFTQSDPFAVDPFAPDPFSDPISTSSQSSNDPFTSIVASPRVKDDSDPFSVFDNTFSSDTFKFDKSSSSRKVKVKVSGQ